MLSVLAFNPYTFIAYSLFLSHDRWIMATEVVPCCRI